MNLKLLFTEEQKLLIEECNLYLGENDYLKFDLSSHSDIGKLKHVGIKMAHPCSGNNHLYISRKTVHFGDFMISVSGTKNIIVIDDAEIEHASIEGRLNILGDENICYFSKRKHHRSILQINFYGHQQFFHWGEGSTSNGTEFTIQGNGRSIIVTDECTFAQDTSVLNSDMHAIFDIESFEQINAPIDIVIHSHVWIGQSATILKSGNIREGSIVGAMSLITQSTDPFSIYAGVPAKKIKSNVSWDRTFEVQPNTINYIQTLKEKTSERD